MNFEVEQKHRVKDEAELVARLAERGATLGPATTQSDQYFAHPCRDFAQTDEALRIRTVGSQSFVTYKGPKVDATTKTRRELELPLELGDAGARQFGQLLAALGFKPVAVVTKQRQSFELHHAGRPVAGSLDTVAGLGTFVELELVTEEQGLAEARGVIAALANELELGPGERRSYLELLLAER